MGEPVKLKEVFCEWIQERFSASKDKIGLLWVKSSKVCSK